MLASPFVAPGRTPGGVGITVTTLIALVAGGVFVAPWVGVVFAIVVLLVLLRPRWRVLLSLLPALMLAACGAYIAAKQWHTRFPPTFEWPTFFSRCGRSAGSSILFLAGDALVEIVRSRRDQRPEDS